MPRASSAPTPVPTPACFAPDLKLKRVFRLDADAFVAYRFKLALRLALCGGAGVCCLPCEVQNLHDYADATYLGITENQRIVYCRDRVPTCWRLPPCDAGRISKEIPLSKVTDVVVLEPAGDCCPAQALYTVRIQTAGNTVIGPELEVQGLSREDAYAFRRMVVAPSESPRRSTMTRA